MSSADYLPILVQAVLAAGITGVVDMVRAGQLQQSGFLKMEEIDCAAFLKNRFGKYYA